jgi:hypothetical protein
MLTRSTLVILFAAPLLLTAAGDPACPPACPNYCSVSTATPVVPAGAPVSISMMWTRKQDGCGMVDCTSCRTCIARIKVSVAVPPNTLANEGGYAKVEWNTSFATTQGTTITGEGQTGVADLPQGPTLFEDTRDVIAPCGSNGLYSVMTTTGIGTTTIAYASYDCLPCSN